MRKNLRLQITVQPEGNQALVVVRYGKTLQNKSSVSCEWDMVEGFITGLVKRVQDTVELHKLFNLKLAGVE